MYDVTGSLCENNDKFAIDRMLPKVDMGITWLFMIQVPTALLWDIIITKLKSSELLLKENGMCS